MIEQGDEGHQLFVIRPSVMSGFFIFREFLSLSGWP